MRSRKENCQLRANPCQITVIEPPGERAYLKYIEDISKNKQGGIKGRHRPKKEVVQHENTRCTDRCPVKLFKLYVSLCPKNRPPGALYLKPLSKPTENCWFSYIPLGHNKLEKTIKRLCMQAGFEGHFTNHSLRRTTATRLYAKGVDEQLIMERTGHSSVGGVRAYKHTTEIEKGNI